ncbi:MAG: amino acid--tRNA ligase-related protein [Nanoarchaeota archaeon]
MIELQKRLQLQSHLLRIAHQYYLGLGYDPIASPKIVPFKDDHPDHLIRVHITDREEELFLSRSPQLYKEIACLKSANGKVYEIGPVFRGEPQGDGRRANEFIGIDAELKTNNLDKILTSLTQLIFFIKEDSEMQGYLKAEKIDANFPDELINISYKEALQILKADEIDSIAEQNLSEYVNRNSPKKRWIYLVDFPAKSRGFYHIRYDVTDSFDLIAGWEICSGGLRRQDISAYFHLLRTIGWSTDEMETYATIKDHHQTNTGGYGIGLERLAGTIINEMNIGTIQPYPRIPETKITF